MWYSIAKWAVWLILTLSVPAAVGVVLSLFTALIFGTLSTALITSSATVHVLLLVAGILAVIPTLVWWLSLIRRLQNLTPQAMQTWAQNTAQSVLIPFLLYSIVFFAILGMAFVIGRCTNIFFTAQ